MMGRGPDGGCGTDERPCRLNSSASSSSRVPAYELSLEAEKPEASLGKKPASAHIDFFSQARKALSERSPFDAPEDGSGSAASGSGSGTSCGSLPSGLASLLRQSDSRKRHKKSHSNADKKSSRPSERSKGGSFWADAEKYFRLLALADIDTLFELFKCFSSLGFSESFLIPHIATTASEQLGRDEHIETRPIVECVDYKANVNCGDERPKENGVVVKAEVKQEDGQLMEIDSAGAQNDGADCLQKDEGYACSVSDSSSSLVWLLGCRNRVALTSERPSKKRKLLGSDAGLDKVLIGSPCDGSLSLCNFCCKGEMGDDSNQLIVCSSCKVAVHIKCYGVQGDGDQTWLCSWCKQKTNGNGIVKQLCLLCPKQGGALKPVSVENGGSAVDFAHLFCSLWMPEVYVEDLTKMEPIRNVGGIHESRRKLVCHVCKVKCGTCVRCSHGTCRTAFHPICAREAKHRMEVWGKFGVDNVELRAFCMKHSDLPDGRTIPHLSDSSLAVSSDSSFANHMPMALMDKPKKLKIGLNGDKISVQMQTSDSISDRSGDSELQDLGLSESQSNAVVKSECGDADQLSNAETFENSGIQANSQSLGSILKKLIEQGKVTAKDAASGIGISPESLLSKLAVMLGKEDSLAPDLQTNLVKWLEKHAYVGTLCKDMKVKLKPAILSKSEMVTADHFDGATVLESDITDPVAVKSVPPRRRTTNNMRILSDNKMICSSEEVLSENGLVVDDAKADQLVNEDPENSTSEALPSTAEKMSNNLGGTERPVTLLPKSEGNSDDLIDGGFSEKVESELAADHKQRISITDQGKTVYLDENSVLPDLVKLEAPSGFYVHPSIHEKLPELQGGKFLKNSTYVLGSRDAEKSQLESSLNASVCLQSEHSNSKVDIVSGGVNSEQLFKAKKLGILDQPPVDEVEGELLYFQHRLLGNAISRKRITDNLIYKVARSLPQEIDATRSQNWDAVVIHQYLCELREARKQGRKERRHKEAQAVLAAATAAAAASSRISSLRKDTLDETVHQERHSIPNGRLGVSSQLMQRPKEILPRVAVSRIASEKYSDLVQPVSDFSKEHPRSCDICRRSESILNPILVCSGCKVAVHLDCYRSVKESTGPWYCELCEELLSSKFSGTTSVNFWEKPYFVAECGVCAGTTGAFRKSGDGQWVHAFCAEWVFEPTFRRGQVNPVNGMGTVAKGIDICGICRRKHGICIKCSFGHCQTTFHPSCARSAGFYMSVKTVNGKLQHKAYCEKHSLEQRMKAETQKHGVEEIKSFKQIRVELEKLRLLCERIIKREKIKRDLVLCSHNILACKRDHVARSVLVHSSYFHTDVSSESATTSLKGNTDGYKSCNDAFQRSDDVTVDSTVSFKHRVKVTVSMDADQKTDDSSTSQNLFTVKPAERLPFAGKQIPQRPSSAASRNHLDDGECSSKSRKRVETFQKELVMTSDQASMKNQQLPKGFFYIPVDCLPKEKQIKQDTNSREPLEPER